MKEPLTIAFVTARKDPKFKWFLQSLRRQASEADQIEIIIVDHYAENPDFVFRKAVVEEEFGGLFKDHPLVTLRHVEGKPSIWKGKHRITREDWWSKGSDLNSSIALCKTPWWSFVDDRSLLWRAWLDRVKIAMENGYAVCGSYDKYSNLGVIGGVMTGGELIGPDTRTPGNYPFDSWYGGSGALPLEWCLAVNGFSEDYCDSLGLEDSMFGVTLQNSGYPVRYDSDMRIIEDRTQGQIDGALKRMDKGTSPNDKSHAIVDAFRGKTTSQNSFDLRELRDRVLAGEPFPPPSASHFDWYDGQSIAEME